MACSASLSIDIEPQILSPTTSMIGCNQVVGQVNTLVMQMNVENALATDVLALKGYPGKIITKTGSMTFNYNSSSNQYQGLLSST